jgi:hypothetical protein
MTLPTGNSLRLSSRRAPFDADLALSNYSGSGFEFRPAGMFLVGSPLDRCCSNSQRPGRHPHPRTGHRSALRSPIVKQKWQSGPRYAIAVSHWSSGEVHESWCNAVSGSHTAVHTVSVRPHSVCRTKHDVSGKTCRHPSASGRSGRERRDHLPRCIEDCSCNGMGRTAKASPVPYRAVCIACAVAIPARKTDLEKE